MSDYYDNEFDELEIDTLDEHFAQAAEQVQRTHDRIMPDELLELYALYKQATVGVCNTAKPGVFNIQARAKWTAWQQLGEMTSVTAKHLYVQKLQQLDPAWYNTLEKGALGQSPSIGWVVHSIPQMPSETVAEHEKTAYDYVKEGNLPQLQQLTHALPPLLQQLDEHGLGLIHWASDRNHVDVLSFLLTAGADVNLRDAEQQTALHYAASCGHVDCVRLLLANKADYTLVDADGQNCVDVAESAMVRVLFETN